MDVHPILTCWICVDLNAVKLKRVELNGINLREEIQIISPLKLMKTNGRIKLCLDDKKCAPRLLWGRAQVIVHTLVYVIQDLWSMGKAGPSNLHYLFSPPMLNKEKNKADKLYSQNLLEQTDAVHTWSWSQ